MSLAALGQKVHLYTNGDGEVRYDGVLVCRDEPSSFGCGGHMYTNGVDGVGYDGVLI